MRKLPVILTVALLVPLLSTSWADPGKDESGNRHFERHDRYEAYREADREVLKRHLEYRREAAKARREQEREAAKAWQEMEREERKHYEEMSREAQKYRDEVRREDYVETIVYVPWND